MNTVIDKIEEAKANARELEERADEVRQSIVAEARSGNGLRSICWFLTVGLLFFNCWILNKRLNTQREAMNNLMTAMKAQEERSIMHLQMIKELSDNDVATEKTRYRFRWVPREGGHGHWEAIDQMRGAQGNPVNEYEPISEPE